MSQAVIKEAIRVGTECPSLETLVRALEPADGQPENRAAADHLSSCLHCRTELSLLREFERVESHQEELEDVQWIAARLAATPVPQLKPKAPAIVPKVIAIKAKWWHAWTSPGRLGALAAAAVLIFAIGIYLPWQSSQRGFGGSGDTLRSAPLRALVPAGDLTSVPKEFQWSAVDGAAQYVLTIQEVDRTVIFQMKTTATSLPVPPEAARLLLPGKALLWNVRAVDSSGREIAVSGEQRFRVGSP